MGMIGSFFCSSFQGFKSTCSPGGCDSQGHRHNGKPGQAWENLLRMQHAPHVSHAARRLVLPDLEGALDTQQVLLQQRTVFRNQTLGAMPLARFRQIRGVVADRGSTGASSCVSCGNSTPLRGHPAASRLASNPCREPGRDGFLYHKAGRSGWRPGTPGRLSRAAANHVSPQGTCRSLCWGLFLERPVVIK